MEISEVKAIEYPELIKIWESSVRATHDFLPEEAILSLKPLILCEYFDAVELFSIKSDNHEIAGFVGVAQANVEMLFISPAHMGRGLGTKLMLHATKTQGATKVDVNEQNPKALKFYQRLGFKIIGRSELDGQGNPFPLLHMALSTDKI
jgi:putative acetyltransferase